LKCYANDIIENIFTKDIEKFLHQKNAKTKQKNYFFEQNIHKDQNDYLKENNVLLSTKPRPNSPKDCLEEDDYVNNSSFDASVIMSSNTQIQELQNEINWLKNEIILIQQHNTKQKEEIIKLNDELDIKESKLFDQNKTINELDANFHDIQKTTQEIILEHSFALKKACNLKDTEDLKISIGEIEDTLKTYLEISSNYMGAFKKLNNVYQGIEKQKKAEELEKKKIKQEQDEQILKLTDGFDDVETIYDKKFETLKSFK